MISDQLSKYNSLESYYTQESQFLTAFQRKMLLDNLQTELRARYRRRIEIMLLADMGYSQAQICTALGCSKETARYWVAMACSGKAHNWNQRLVGRPKMVNEEYLKRLQELVSHSPRDYGYSFRRWTAHWLSKHLAKEFGIEVSVRHINRLLHKLGLSARQKSASVGKGTGNIKNCGIDIGDIGELPSASPLKFLELFNFINTSN